SLAALRDLYPVGADDPNSPIGGKSPSTALTSSLSALVDHHHPLRSASLPARTHQATLRATPSAQIRLSRTANLQSTTARRPRAAGLERWLREVELGFADRVLPVTLPVASAWGRQQHAQPLPVIDGLIAATAKVNSLTVVTRNAKDFERTGAQVLNPFGD